MLLIPALPSQELEEKVSDLESEVSRLQEALEEERDRVAAAPVDYDVPLTAAPIGGTTSEEVEVSSIQCRYRS